MIDFEAQDGVVYLGDGVHVQATIQAPRAVVVDGTMSGEIACRQLIVGSSGNFTGEAGVSEADIGGKISAHIVATETLALRSTARVEGSWECAEIVAERGAILNGAAGRLEGAPRPSERAGKRG